MGVKEGGLDWEVVMEGGRFGWQRGKVERQECWIGRQAEGFKEGMKVGRQEMRSGEEGNKGWEAGREDSEAKESARR